MFSHSISASSPSSFHEATARVLPNEKAPVIDNADWIHAQPLIGSYGHRSKHTSVSFTNARNEPCILIFGGQSDSTHSSSSTSTTSNSSNHHLSGSNNNHHHSVGGGDVFMYVIKRLQDNGEWHCYSPPVKNPTNAPPRVRGHSAVYFEGRMIVFGGKNNFRYFDQLFSLNCSTWEWSHIISLQRFSTTRFITNGQSNKKNRSASSSLHNNSTTPQNSSSSSSVVGRTIREQISFESMIKLPCKRSNHTAVVLPKYRKMIVYGGRSYGETLGDLWAFDLEEYQWDNIQMDPHKSLIPSERHSHSATALQENPNVMIIYGGNNGSSQLNDLWMFDYSATVFTPITMWNSVLSNPSLSFKTSDPGATNAIQVANSILLGKKASNSDSKNLLIPTPRESHQLISLGKGYLMVHGGYSKKRFIKDFNIIDLQRMEYIDCTSIPRKKIPCSRKCHTLNNISEEYISMVGGVSRKRGKLDDFNLIDKEMLKSFILTDGDASLVEELKTVLEKKYNIHLESSPDASSIRNSISITHLESNNHDKRKSVRISQSLSKDSLLEIGSILLTLREYHKAISYFTLVLQIDPNNKMAFEKRGICHFMTEDILASIQDFSECNSPESQILKAYAFLRIGKYREASNVMHMLKNSYSGSQLPVLVEVIKQLLDSYESSIESKNKSSTQRELRASRAYFATNIDDYVFEPQSGRYVDLESENKPSEEGHVNFSIAEPYSLLFIGQHECGMTSYLQQIRSMFRQSISIKEAKVFKPKIQNYTIGLYHQWMSFKKVLEAFDKDACPIQVSQDLEKLSNQVFDYLEMNKSDKDGLSIYPIAKVQKLVMQLGSNREFQKICSNFASLYEILKTKYYFCSLQEEIHKLFHNANVPYFFKETNRILSTDYLPTDMDIISFPIKYHFCPLNLIACEKKSYEESLDLNATNSPLPAMNHSEENLVSTASSPSPTRLEMNDTTTINTNGHPTRDLISFDDDKILPSTQNVKQVIGDFTKTIFSNIIEQHQDNNDNNSDKDRSTHVHHDHTIQPLDQMRGSVVERNDHFLDSHQDIPSCFKPPYSDDMFIGDISIYKDSMDSLDLNVEQSPLEFIFKRTPYTIFSTTACSDEEKVTSAIRELSIDSIAVITSLHDVDRKVQSSHQQIPVYSFMNGQVMADGKSASSIVNTLRMCEKLLNQEAFGDTQIIFIFTHHDVFVRKAAQDPNLLKNVFPTYQASTKKSPQKYLEEMFEIFNDKYRKRRRFHFSFVNTLDKDDVKRSFKTIHEIVHSVELKRQLETYKML
ncbi:hypothetical protein C9374_001615 [Naegleria lovaniensis]|uniref:Uncharacterized protein n=1 Tax=Naegleria lovaniensis TaxID=51637 RepID=A0AA88GX16_NAELO|nr:uncharacterized protein C9374_001615 [Naegleria lovaniensis]KAG2387283.1 hypothetical protein C9374_001615 [Naegleria lovaniensis]